MAAARQPRPISASDDAQKPKRILRRTKVLTTDMGDGEPAVKKKRAVRKPAVKTKPKAAKTAAIVSEHDPETSQEATSGSDQSTAPRPPRRSAAERLNDPPPASGPLLVTRVANAIERELTQIEIIIGNHRVPPRERSEAERRARTLASLARTLAIVTQLRSTNVKRLDGDADDDDTMPRDLDEFRDTLARRLERLLADRAQSSDCEPDAG